MRPRWSPAPVREIVQGPCIRKAANASPSSAAGLLAVAAPAAPRRAAPGATAAAATITAEDVARRIGVIADDSMLGRDTPSKGLELTAQYVADQFRSFGLGPGGENGTWFQRYSISRRRLVLDRSRVVLRSGPSAHGAVRRSARYVQGACRRPGQRAGDAGGRSR